LATFVAIIAGFYTTKVISLTSDKRRILHKINALDIEIQTKNDYLESLKKTQSDTLNREDTEGIDAFIEFVKSEFYLYLQNSLREFFNKQFKQPITENQERILRDRTILRLRMSTKS
jgi:hypothetical protein